MARAVERAYQKTLHCKYLKERHAKGRRKMLEAYGSKVVRYEYSVDHSFCGVYRGKIMGRSFIEISWDALREDPLCGALENVVFHEMIHYGWDKGLIERVSHDEIDEIIFQCYSH